MLAGGDVVYPYISGYRTAADMMPHWWDHYRFVRRLFEDFKGEGGEIRKMDGFRWEAYSKVTRIDGGKLITVQAIKFSRSYFHDVYHASRDHHEYRIKFFDDHGKVITELGPSTWEGYVILPADLQQSGLDFLTVGALQAVSKRPVKITYK